MSFGDLVFITATSLKALLLAISQPLVVLLTNVSLLKCDEGHPACRNCQKSKRECLGYDPIFKPPPGPPPLQPASQQYPSMSHTPPASYPPPPPQGYSPAAYGAPVIEGEPPASTVDNAIDPALNVVPGDNSNTEGAVEGHPDQRSRRGETFYPSMSVLFRDTRLTFSKQNVQKSRIFFA